MKIVLNGELPAMLKARLAESEDAESTGSNEYVLDLFDEEPPLSLELQLEPDGADILAAVEMRYDEMSDGYCFVRRLYDIEEIERVLTGWIAR